MPQGSSGTGACRVFTSTSIPQRSSDGRDERRASAPAQRLRRGSRPYSLLKQAGRTRAPRRPCSPCGGTALPKAGRGSGYDVLCSWHGGTGIFRGGETPSWEARSLAAGLRLCLFPGPAAVQTTGAVLRYAAWKKGNHFAARDFMEESNRRVLAFLDAGSTEMAARWAECRMLGIQLGEAVGVPAAITPPAGVDPALCKSIGAGNELGVCLVPDGEEPPLPLLPVASQGLKWE